MDVVANETPCKGEWIGLWRYALALSVSTSKLRASLICAGVPVMVIAGEYQVQHADIERFIEERRHEAQARANKHASPKARSSKPGALEPINQKLEQQSAELETLKRQVEALQAARSQP